MVSVDLDGLVLSPPLPLVPIKLLAIGDGDCDHSDGEHRQKSSLFARVLNLLKSVKPGSDLTRFRVPVQFNLTKSQLQSYGETVYCCRKDLLGECVQGSTPLERFLRVVAWHISTCRLVPFGQVPFNPILGETHHVSSGSLNILLEQVSHHPPISALYATDDVRKLRLQWWQNACPRFYGNKVEATIHGKRTLWLDSHQEEYEMTSPKLSIRLFPAPGTDWVGSSTIKCRSSGLEAIINFKEKPFFGLKGVPGQLSGHILDTCIMERLYDVSGAWNRVVMLKDKKTGESSLLFDAHEALTDLKGLILRNQNEMIESTESVIVWREVMRSMMKRDWEGARKAKNEVEDEQRNMVKKRKQDGIQWTPKHFVEVKDCDKRWQWRHIGQSVSVAPLVVP